MARTSLLIVYLGTTLPLLFFSPSEARGLGVTYGRVGNDLPDPASVVKLLKENGITMVRIYDTNSTVLKALANTGIKVLVMLDNDDLAAAATSPLYALRWVRCNVAAYYPATLIDGVAVGNEVFMWRPDLTQQLVPAMINVQLALANLGLADAVKVSTPVAFTALKDTFPPSSARFRDDIAQSVMKPMFEFLWRTGSYLSMNPYPFFAYAEDPQNIPLNYALGNYKPGVLDKNTGLVYHSLLDAMMDATYYAIENLTEQYLNIRHPIGSGANQYVTTTWTEGVGGWSSRGVVKQRKPPKGGRNLCQCQPATVANAKAYNNYVINRVLSGNTGTPHRPDADIDTYIFALFNENEKGDGPDDAERYFGLFYPNGTKVYDFDFHPSWCVADAAVEEALLQGALDYACSHGADCGAIQPGGECFEPNTRVAHASYAFNSYYQHNHRAPGTCDFDGAAYVVYQAPRSMALTRLLVVLLGTTLPVLFFFSPAEAGEVGVSYGRVANDLPDPASVVKLLQRHGITMVRLYDANSTVLKALANTGIKVTVMLDNDDLAAAAASRLHALRWARRNVAAHSPATLINGVEVGNEVFEWRPELTPQLVPAMINVQLALAKLGLADAVKVSTPIAFTALKDTFPPSAARFRDDIAQSVMKPMLQFLQRTGSYLSMNPYPFFAYAEDPQNIKLEYALGHYKPGVLDWNTGLVYHSLLDAMMDATYYAMENLTEHLNIIRQPMGSGSLNNGRPGARWSETGWSKRGIIRPGRPRKGRRNLEAGAGFQPATVANAKAYNNHVIDRVVSGNTGTPHRPDADMDVYIFALFDENEKGDGPDDAERYFGLFYPNETKGYDFDFHPSWCVANAAVGEDRLQKALDYACGNGADCGAIQPGGKCFEPNTRVAHASYAFNSFYQRNHRAPGTCDFGGAAYVVHQAPKYGNCVLPWKALIDGRPAKSEGYAAM
ncbi:hypothetical protein EJB05_12054 [Eragrostis curvula]|uniref:X8 domain-containing protein n=1 Tax=Eragrostis curvula TaxID=38414 RepID=A0A5J9VUB7_9POAL|nr:hypothetical protein EJB05_12054 [Eragrostis curvula]